MFQSQSEISEYQKKELELYAKIRTCPNCDTLNPEGIKFCQECGSRMNQSTSIKCLGCGAEHSIGIRFCGECGRQL